MSCACRLVGQRTVVPSAAALLASSAGTYLTSPHAICKSAQSRG